MVATAHRVRIVVVQMERRVAVQQERAVTEVVVSKQFVMNVGEISRRVMLVLLRLSVKKIMKLIRLEEIVVHLSLQVLAA
jgi:hypothetical protein